MTRRLLAPALAAALAGSSASAAWYDEMEIGPAWSNTFSHTRDGEEVVAAVKGILIDLGDNHHALFDTETLRYVTVYEGGVHWGGTPWTGAHGQLVSAANEEGELLANGPGPGWADAEGSFDDPRPLQTYTMYTKDRKKRDLEGRFGDIPGRRFLGFYRHGEKIVLEYEVHGTRVLDHPALADGEFVRFLEIAPHEQPLEVRVAGERTVEIPAAGETTRLTLGPAAETPDPIDLQPLLEGGPALWDGVIETEARVSGADTPWVVDTLTLPDNNPWKANLRFGGFDFIDADRAALCSWNGEVWIVSGLEEMKTLKWKRFASGLFETLGLKVVDGEILVNGRDQITRLVDLNGDHAADHFEVFNRDVTVSPNFHEFAFGLQADAAGNLYFAKASPVRPGGRGFDLILANHGTVVKVSPDGATSEVVATGLRAPGGLGIGPEGQLTTGENEGTWQPCCKINFARQDELPVFFGTEDSRHSLTSAEYHEPLCYLPMDVDNSGGGQVWVPEGAGFGLEPGTMLHLSYGKSSIYRVMPETVDGTLQGGVVRLPVDLQSSAMRARFHPSGDLFVLGFRGWQTNAASECAFHRIRYTGAPVPIPSRLETTPTGVRIGFEVELDEELAADPFSYSVQRWDYVRGPQYGSGEFSVDQPDEKARELALQKPSKNHKQRDNVEVTGAKLLPDGKTVELELAGHKPSMQLKVSYDLESADGEVLISDIHSTVREIPN